MIIIKHHILKHHILELPIKSEGSATSVDSVRVPDLKAQGLSQIKASVVRTLWAQTSIA